MAEIFHYLYLNKDLIINYSDQLGEKVAKRRSLTKISSRITMSLLGPRMESIREYIISDKSYRERIEAINNHLHSNKLIFNERPANLCDYHDRQKSGAIFVRESMLSTRVYLNKDKVKSLPDSKNMVVWISNPLLMKSEDEYINTLYFDGSFLYLTQQQFDDKEPGFLVSGCSALQAVLNGFTGTPKITDCFGETLCRSTFEHPVNKLIELGGIASHPTWIESIYRLRYMTNEQFCKMNGMEFRTNDVLAYPLYIREIPIPKNQGNS